MMEGELRSLRRFSIASKSKLFWHVCVLIGDSATGHRARMDDTLLTGTMRAPCEPDWLPLERLLGSDDLCGHFMWMFQVMLENGTVLNAYKHWWTRRYLHLEADGTAYRYVSEDSYRQVSTRWLLAEVFETPGIWEPTASEGRALADALERCRT